MGIECYGSLYLLVENNCLYFLVVKNFFCYVYSFNSYLFIVFVLLGAQFTDEQIQNFGLCEIEKLLHQNGKNLKDFPPMSLPDVDFARKLCNRLIDEQLNFDREALARECESILSTMMGEQLSILNTILEVVSTNSDGFFFVNDHGSTGKTYLWRVLTSILQSKGEIVLTIASSRIASTFLQAERTTHSRFCILYYIYYMH